MTKNGGGRARAAPGPTADQGTCLWWIGGTDPLPQMMPIISKFTRGKKDR